MPIKNSKQRIKQRQKSALERRKKDVKKWQHQSDADESTKKKLEKAQEEVAILEKRI